MPPARQVRAGRRSLLHPLQNLRQVQRVVMQTRNRIWQRRIAVPPAPPAPPAVPAPPAAPAPPAPRARPPSVEPYTKWVSEDVAYIITDAERAAFKRLESNEERDYFIEQFWLRRDPTPDTPENEFKEEHYRRIAYANENFASSVPGWKTDRGR